MAQASLTDSGSAGNGSQGLMPVLSLVNGKPRASSLGIAEHFKKRHDNVLRSITQTCHDLPSNFCALNFEETSITVPGPKGGTRQERAYLMTRDGFTLIVMSFTGKEAMTWKLRYIEAFNAMEAELSRQQSCSALTTITPSQQQELQNIVAAKASAYPKEALGRVRAQLWSRLHNKFKVAKYDQLPTGSFPEAVEYLVGLAVRGAFPEVLPEAEQVKALPALRRRASLDDYRDLFRALPESPAYWDSLRARLFAASEAFAKELATIHDEATRPFRVKRKHEVRTYFDAAIAPISCLFEDAEQAHSMAYRSVYNALEGCQSVWRLLRIG